MNRNRDVALAATVACVLLVLAQYAVPAWPGFHSWQYAAVLVAGAAAIGRYALSARTGADGERGTRLTVTMLGALVITAAGLASGLLGPDTETVSSAPGTVAPLPDVGAAAFFPIADATAIARGDVHVRLRRRNGFDIDIGPRGYRYIGTTALTTQAHVVAYIEARDRRNQHLTVTQPTNAAFLSPVLFFTGRVTIANQELPSDAFAIPALHRQIKAFYFAKDAAKHKVGGAAQPAVLFAADDDAGRLLPGAIGFAQSGQALWLAGVRLRPTLGTYPVLLVSAVPVPLAVGLGAILVIAGLGYAWRAPRPAIPL